MPIRYVHEKVLEWRDFLNIKLPVKVVVYKLGTKWISTVLFNNVPEAAHEHKRKSEAIRWAEAKKSIANLRRAIDDLRGEDASESDIAPYLKNLAFWEEQLRKLEGK